MNVREIQSGEENRWDAYVRDCPFGTPQHLFSWKNVMEEVFNSKTYYLIAEDKGEIKGVLPLIHVKSLLAGNYFTSQPGGICTDNEGTARLLFDYTKELVHSHHAQYLILRDGRKKWDLPDIVTDEEHVAFIIEILSNLDQIKQTFTRTTRQKINKISNDGLTSQVGLDELNTYYPIYSRSMQEIGTPTLGLNFFNNLKTHLTDKIDLITISLKDQVVGGGYIAPLNSTVFCLWSGLLHEYYDFHTAYLLIWRAIGYAFDNRYSYLDLGRCRKNSGGFDFKRQFGGQEQQLYQQIYLNGIGKTPLVGAEKKADIKYRYFTALWQILPLPVTEWLGPLLRKQMPFG